MSRPVITVARASADRLIVDLVQVPGDDHRRTVVSAVETLCRRIGLPQDLGSLGDEIHVLLFELTATEAIRRLIEDGDALDVDVREVTR